MLPGLARIGLAPLLIADIKSALEPMLVGFTAFCALLQAVLLMWMAGVSSLWRELRGRLLLVVLLVASVSLVVLYSLPEAVRLQAFNFMVLALCGLVLVVQPLPGQRP